MAATTMRRSRLGGRSDATRTQARSRALRLLHLVAWCGGVAQASAQTARFYALGDLPGGLPWSSARAVSADGRVVAGVSKSDAGDEAFRWTADTGMVGLGDLAGGSSRSITRGMSGDGSVIIGQGQVDTGNAAFRWALPLGMEPLSSLAGVDESVANGCSLDGNVIIGTARVGTSSLAFRWTSNSTFADVLAPSENGTLGNTEAHGISPSGQWIAGSIAPDGPEVASIWSTSTGWVVIGDIPGGGEDSSAVAVNDNGDIAACNGSSLSSGTSFEAYRWANGVIEPLGDLPGGTFQSFATGMSADGSVIIGYSDGTPPPDFRYYDAFIWDSAHGMRKLQDMLFTDYGLKLPGWKLVIPFAISGDGQNIVGVGVNPAGNSEGWLVRLGETCPADFNHDGYVTGEDFDAFIAAFTSGDDSADLDGDGFISGTDFDLYVMRFASGC